MEDKTESNNQDDYWLSSFRLPSKSKRRQSKVMMAVILAALQILLLLLKAHFNRNEDREKALAHIKEAQEKLAEVALEFESKIRLIYNNLNSKLKLKYIPVIYCQISEILET